MALPLLGALGGAGATAALGYTSMTALTMGASIGWMVGSWGMMATMDTGNDPIDTGANEAPRFNTAVRGQQYPVLFGTNRVPGQILWQDNFEAIRSESEGGGGGGKFGGSGGGKAPKTGSAGGSYTYKMDAIYHLGFVPVPVTLIGGWLGGERISDGSITSISIGSSSGFESLAQDDDDPDTAGISYDEGIFFAGDIDEENDWDHLTSAVGHPIRWPGTTWVGFAGMDLGSTASLPQLNFEVGPEAGVTEANTHAIWAINPGVGVERFMGVDVNGATYWMDTETNIQVHDVNGVLIFSKSQAQISADLTVLGVGAPAIIMQEICVKPLNGGLKVAIVAHYVQTTFKMAVMIADVPVLGDTGFSYTGWCWCACDSFSDFEIHEFLDALGNNYMLAVECTDFTSSDLYINTFPSVSDIELPNTDYIGSHFTSTATFSTFECAWVYMTVNNSGGDLNGYKGGGSQSPEKNGWAISRIDPLTFLPEHRVYYKRGKDFIDNQGNGICGQFVDDNYVANPEGFALYAPLSGANQYTVDFGGAVDKINGSTISYTLCTPKFVDNTGDPKWFFTDEGKRIYDGLASPDFGYDEVSYGSTPWVQSLGSGAYLCLFTAADNDATYDALFGKATTFAKVRAYVFYSQTEEFRYMGAISGPILAQGDLGKTFDETSNHITFTDCKAYRYGSTLYVGLTDDAFNIVSNVGQINFGGGDCTPPYIIREILVNEVFGIQPGANVIDETTYNTAVSYCEANNIYVSTQYRREASGLQYIESLLALYGGWLTVLPAENKVEFGVMELNNSSMRTLDNHHLLVKEKGTPPIQTTKGAPQDTNNIIRVNYIERSNNYQINQVEDRDEIDEDESGPRPREFAPDFVMERTLAQWLATRTLWSNLYTRDAYKLYVGWKDADLKPGNIVTLVDSFDDINTTAQIVFKKEVDRGVFELTATQQLPYIAGVSPSQVSSATWGVIARGGTDISSQSYWASSGTLSMSGSTLDPSDPYDFGVLGPIPAPVYHQAYELPQEFQVNDAGIVYVGWRADAFAAGAKLYVSADGLSYAPAMSTTPFAYAGRLLTDLTSDPGQMFAEQVEFIMHPSSSWTANSPAYTNNVTLNDVDAAAMHVGAGLLWCGSEMLSYTGLTLVGQNRYKAARMYRGWGGTNHQAHSSGDNFHKHGSGVLSREFGTDQIGTIFYYKVVPFNLSGYEYNVSSVAGTAYTIKGQHWRPQNAANIQFRGNRGNTKINVGSEIDIDLEWQDGARKSGFGSGGFGTAPGGYGGFTTDTLSHHWEVSVVGSGNTVVRTTTTGSPGWVYTNSQNVGDNGAWRGKPAVSITAMSPYGPSTQTRVISLDLFF